MPFYETPTKGSVMDLKQKYEDTKAKLQEHAPVIAKVSSAIAVVATTVAVIMYSEQKKSFAAFQKSDKWIRDHKEYGICYLSEEDQEYLKEGSGALVFNYGITPDNYCLMHCNETHKDGDHTK